MQHTRKMVLIPAERFDRENLGNQIIQKSNISRQISQSGINKDQNENPELNSIQTLGDNLSRLDSEMYNILFSKQFNNDYEKSKNYLQVLQRYLHFKEKERRGIQEYNLTSDTVNENLQENLQNLTAESEKSSNYLSFKNDIIHKSIIDSIPKSYQKKALVLLEIWEKTGKISWDNQGLTSINGNIIVNSNIKDFLNHISRRRIGIQDPIGIKEFIKFLIESDTPKNLIGNKDIVTQMKQKSPSKNFSKNTKKLRNTSVSNISAASTPKEKKVNEKAFWIKY